MTDIAKTCDAELYALAKSFVKLKADLRRTGNAMTPHEEEATKETIKLIDQSCRDDLLPPARTPNKPHSGPALR